MGGSKFKKYDALENFYEYGTYVKEFWAPFVPSSAEHACHQLGFSGCICPRTGMSTYGTPTVWWFSFSVNWVVVISKMNGMEGDVI